MLFHQFINEICESDESLYHSILHDPTTFYLYSLHYITEEDSKEMLSLNWFKDKLKDTTIPLLFFNQLYERIHLVKKIFNQTGGILSFFSVLSIMEKDLFIKSKMLNDPISFQIFSIVYYTAQVEFRSENM